MPRIYPFLLVVSGILTSVGVIVTLQYTFNQKYRTVNRPRRRRSSTRQPTRRRRRRRRQQRQQQQQDGEGEEGEHEDWLLPLYLETDEEEQGSDDGSDDQQDNTPQSPLSPPSLPTVVAAPTSATAGSDNNNNNNNPASYPNPHTDRLLSLFTEWQDDDEGGENKNLLQLLHAISENQARKEGYIHRGITCNKCAVSPIRGIRYKCANCVDFDLCDMCEASFSHHTQTHVFLKIRIPIPPLANPRSALLPPFYPGKNDRLTLSSDQARVLAAQSHFDHVELEALFAQYKSLSVVETPATATQIGGGINKATFEQCLGPLGMEKNLITERIFYFFDRDRDGIITFPELVDGLSVLCKGNLDEKIEYAFNGYDLDEDGYISRDELYWMFKSYFYLSMELVRDVVSAMEDEMMDQYDFPAGQPVSAAFNVPIPSSSSNNNSDDDDDDDNDTSSHSGDEETTPVSETTGYPQKQDYFMDGSGDTNKNNDDDIHNNTDNNKKEKKKSQEDQMAKQEWEEKFPIMETMAQDAIHEMVNKTFRNMVTRREGYISFDEFKQCVQTDSSIVSWFEALGTVF